MLTLKLSLLLNEKDPGPTNRAFEQRKVLLNNFGYSIDAQNLKYQDMQKRLCSGKFLKFGVTKTL